MNTCELNEILKEAIICVEDFDFAGATECLTKARVGGMPTLLDISITEFVFKHFEACISEKEKTSRKMNVYFIKSKASGLVKIGKTVKSVEKRMSQISTMCAGGIEILLVLNDVDFECENILHREFKHLRVHGEWFLYLDELKAYIDIKQLSQ